MYNGLAFLISTHWFSSHLRWSDGGPDMTLDRLDVIIIILKGAGHFKRQKWVMVGGMKPPPGQTLKHCQPWTIHDFNHWRVLENCQCMRCHGKCWVRPTDRTEGTFIILKDLDNILTWQFSANKNLFSSSTHTFVIQVFPSQSYRHS